jgi:hypothetical protein
MQKALHMTGSLLLLTASMLGQGKRLWVLQEPGAMVEYDLANFAAEQTVKLPVEALRLPQSVAVNRLGQILFAPTVSLPLSESDVQSTGKVWFWNGHTAITIDPGVKREVGTTGSNQEVTELAPGVYLSADGGHLFWFANQSRRLQREDVDLSVTTMWQAWQTDLSGGNREDLVPTVKLADCRCTTGSCEETCPYGVVWAPAGGIGKFFLMTEFITGKTEAIYKASTRYQQESGKWMANTITDPLRRVLDADASGNVIVEAIPDTGCCGWANQSDDQTVVRNNGKKVIVFDEQATYKNPDYDVSFFTSNALLSPELDYVAMTIAATAQANQPIQLAEQGQANPEESKQIRAALTELPAVEIKTLGEAPKRVAFVPHATLVGWISGTDVLLVEDHVLVAYSVGKGTLRKSTVKVEDPARVFFR